MLEKKYRSKVSIPFKITSAMNVIKNLSQILHVEPYLRFNTALLQLNEQNRQIISKLITWQGKIIRRHVTNPRRPFTIIINEQFKVSKYARYVTKIKLTGNRKIENEQRHVITTTTLVESSLENKRSLVPSSRERY